MTFSARFKLIEEPNGFTVYIRAPKYYFHILFALVWWPLWTFGGFAVLTAIFTEPARKDLFFILLWLCLWFCAWVFIAYSWLWMVFGKEVISIRRDVLTIKRDMFGWGKSISIPLAEIYDLRIRTEKPPFFSSERSMGRWGLGWPTLTVYWRDKTHRFGLKLHSDEAEFLYDKIEHFIARTSNNLFNRAAD